MYWLALLPQTIQGHDLIGWWIITWKCGTMNKWIILHLPNLGQSWPSFFFLVFFCGGCWFPGCSHKWSCWSLFSLTLTSFALLHGIFPFIFSKQYIRWHFVPSFYKKSFVNNNTLYPVKSLDIVSKFISQYSWPQNLISERFTWIVMEDNGPFCLFGVMRSPYLIKNKG